MQRLSRQELSEGRSALEKKLKKLQKDIKETEARSTHKKPESN